MRNMFTLGLVLMFAAGCATQPTQVQPVAKEETRARKEALNLVVAERNALVHEMLSTFDDSSAESCQKFIVLLDEQHDRVAPQYEYVMRILAGMKTVHQEVAKLLTSGVVVPVEDNGSAT